MTWYVWISVVGCFIAIWHEIIRFPATNASINGIFKRLGELESENRNLWERIDYLDNEILSLSNALEEIKDPVYHQAIKDNDGLALHELDKIRGENS
ncbi:hypothetical protein J6J08_05080 [Pseudidiomarina sp. 1APR75-33.1]|uniref:hypothetical protein n=1 Tax=Pseudidiomarina terrestris TaxID=2820060 RepID=UPI00265227FB|nr:hypothetical protein [Pseudidiomarina sp. 1APR75-33.1]MDN7126747.1 hypothetical protein [Pseudidiomarina sp. 1APR75-33.1]